MIVIAISSTNHFPLISVDAFHRPCGAAAVGRSPSDPASDAPTSRTHRAGRGEERGTGGSRHRWQRRGRKKSSRVSPGGRAWCLVWFARAARSLAAAHANPLGPARWQWARCSPRRFGCPVASGTSGSPGAAPGQLLPAEMCFSSGCFPRFPPEGAAGDEADASWHSRSDFIPVAAVYAAVW